MIESYSQKEIKEKIDQYVMGRLSADEIEELWIELIQNEYYLDYLKTVANLKAVVAKRKSKARAAKVRTRWSYVAAAVIALLIGVLTILNYPGFNLNTEVHPIDKIELNYYRSAGETTGDPETSRIIKNAIALANTGKFDEAVALLENELEKAEDPKWISEISLSLGSLFYNHGNYQEAVSYYNNILNYKEVIGVLTLEKAYWYLGNAYFQLDQLDKARSAIEKAFNLNGAYRRVAQSYLNALSS